MPVVSHFSRRQFAKIFGFGSMLLGSSLFPTLASASETFVPMLQPIKKRTLPPMLKKNDTVGLTAPSGAVTKAKFETALQTIDQLGFKPYYTNQPTKNFGYFGGTDQQRANDLLHMFEQPEVKGIFCIRGGYGAARILPLLDYKIIRRHPKALIGFSDITALLNTIYQETGLVGFHAPVAIWEFTDYTTQQFRLALMQSQAPIEIHRCLEDAQQEDVVFTPYVIHPGIAEGELVGGNLTVLASMIGTPYEVDCKGKLLFLEDIDEAPYRIDRMLNQLKQTHHLDKLAGVILGVFKGCEDMEAKIPPNNAFTLAEVLTSYFKPLGIPAVYGFSFGHIPNNAIMPIGCHAQLDTSNQTLTLNHPCVCSI